MKSTHAFQRLLQASPIVVLTVVSRLAPAQGFDKISTTVTNVNTILATISVAVVTIAIIWAGFKMIFQGARLTDVANVLIGGTLIGGAGAFAAFIVN
ncbi:MAG: TrbC/VirB2 family protein [Paucibacter sp.]|nr:TrbC/VirB2 family protein [Roseateles sp.]